MNSSPARDLRELLATLAAKATADSPQRLLVERRAPLTSQGDRLGFLDLLLRISCHGDGRGPGVLVLDWPQAASAHSVVRRLEQWRARHAGDNAVQIECGQGDMVGSGGAAIPSIHLKVHLDGASIPEALFDLLDLACRVGVLEPVREAVGRLAGAAPATNGHVRPAAPRAPEEQSRIDRIENHAIYDGGQHPQANPNDEVVNSRGEVFRLICRRSAGAWHRQWLRVAQAAAPCAARGS